jgi:hypothetical protein
MILFKTNPLWCLKDGDDEGGGGGGKEPAAEPTSIKVGDQQLTVEQIQELQERASVGAKVVEEANRYGIPAESFLETSNRAIMVAADLREQGYLDDDGTIKIPQPSKEPAPSPAPRKEPNDALPDELKNLSKRLDVFEESLLQLNRAKVIDVVQSKFGNLTDDDISICAAEARRTGQRILDVAKVRSEQKQVSEQEKENALKAKLAEEYGLDFEKLNEQKNLDPNGPSPSTFIQGKKLSMRRKDPKAIHPRQALTEFLDAQERAKAGG